MTQPSIQAQVETIKKVTEKVLQSKETTLKFLQEAGILKEGKSKKEKKEKKEIVTPSTLSNYRLS